MKTKYNEKMEKGCIRKRKILNEFWIYVSLYICQ